MIKTSFPEEQLRDGKNVVGYSRIDLLPFRLFKSVEYKMWLNIQGEILKPTHGNLKFEKANIHSFSKLLPSP